MAFKTEKQRARGESPGKHSSFSAAGVAPLRLAHTPATQVIETNNFKKIFVFGIKTSPTLKIISKKRTEEKRNWGLS